MSEERSCEIELVDDAVHYSGQYYGAISELDGEIEQITKIADICSDNCPRLHDSMLHTIVEHMQDIAVLIDKNLQILEISPIARELLGSPSNVEDIIRTSRVISSVMRDTSGNEITIDNIVFNRAIQGERIKNELYELTFDDNSKRYYIANGTPIRNEDGEIEMALVIARDITDLKELQLRTEEMLAELSQQQANLKYLLSHMPAGVILLDTDLKLVRANRTYSDYFDKSLEWHPNLSLHDILPLAKESGIVSVLHKAIDTNKPISVDNFKYTGFDKGVTYWSGSAIPMRFQLHEESTQGVALVVVDITQEVNARQRLAELAKLAERRAAETEVERERLNTIIQSTPVPLIIYDSSTRAVTYNSAAFELFEALGLKAWLLCNGRCRPLEGIEILDDKGNAIDLKQCLIEKSLNGETCRDMVVNYRVASRGNWILSLNTAPLKDACGKVTGFVAALTDITEQIRAREQIQEIYRREHAIAEKLQRSFMPSHLPDLGIFKIAQRYRPALDEALVGGDFYDVFHLEGNKFGIVIADVAGKGLRAAVYTAMTKYMLRAYALEDSAPELVLARLNEALTACTPSEIFVTLVYGVLDNQKKTFTYANAGHEQPLYYRDDIQAVTTLDVTGRALALMKGSSYTTHTVEMGIGDVVVLYTDGITDAGWGDNRLGQDRLLEMLEISAQYSVSELADAILNDAMEFTGGQLGDDAALLIIKTIDGEPA